MPKKIFQRYLPNSKSIREIKSLEFLGEKLHAPNLWHLNRRSVSLAFACGLWAMYTPPLPWQMVIAAVLAIYFNANLPIAVSLVWITNPLTWVPLYYFAYKVGSMVLGLSAFDFTQFSSLFSIDTALELGKPLLLGCFILMNVGAALGYASTQILWRCSVLNRVALKKYRKQPLNSSILVNHSCSAYSRMLNEKNRQV